MNSSVHARCRCCKQWIGCYQFCGVTIFEQNDKHRWVVKEDISLWPWFEKIIIVDEIFCSCGNRLGFKLPGHQTEVLKSAIELITFHL